LKAILKVATSRLFRRSRIPLGILWVFVVLLLNLLAASPALHARVHTDAGNSDHQCAITLFAHGQVDSPVTDTLATVPAGVVEIRPQFSVLTPDVRVALLPPGRAPPVSSFNS
jgi:hypothetical protein